MKKFLALLLIFSCFACSNQVLPTVQEADDLGVIVVNNDPPTFGTVDIDQRVFQNITILSASNDGCTFQESGPYNRVQTDPRLTGNVNVVSTKIFLPKAAASEELAPNSDKSKYTPNIYTGGRVEGGAAIVIEMACG
jgi:hypothetical protein